MDRVSEPPTGAEPAMPEAIPESGDGEQCFHATSETPC